MKQDLTTVLDAEFKKGDNRNDERIKKDLLKEKQIIVKGNRNYELIKLDNSIAEIKTNQETMKNRLNNTIAVQIIITKENE